ncbi:MAG: hypothetical protein HPY50_09370 [Firmicutes bacterium]|nr:hypothetical protein [Bacillota bacterium]
MEESTSSRPKPDFSTGTLVYGMIIGLIGDLVAITVLYLEVSVHDPLAFWALIVGLLSPFILGPLVLSLIYIFLNFKKLKTISSRPRKALAVISLVLNLPIVVTTGVLLTAVFLLVIDMLMH